MLSACSTSICSAKPSSSTVAETLLPPNNSNSCLGCVQQEQLSGLEMASYSYPTPSTPASRPMQQVPVQINTTTSSLMGSGANNCTPDYCNLPPRQSSAALAAAAAAVSNSFSSKRRLNADSRDSVWSLHDDEVNEANNEFSEAAALVHYSHDLSDAPLPPPPPLHINQEQQHYYQNNRLSRHSSSIEALN